LLCLGSAAQQDTIIISTSTAPFAVYNWSRHRRGYVCIFSQEHRFLCCFLILGTPVHDDQDGGNDDGDLDQPGASNASTS
jgi:hypothetical protein